MVNITISLVLASILAGVSQVTEDLAADPLRKPGWALQPNFRQDAGPRWGGAIPANGLLEKIFMFQNYMQRKNKIRYQTQCLAKSDATILIPKSAASIFVNFQPKLRT